MFGQLAHFSMPQLSNISEKFWREKEANFNGMNLLTFSKLKNKEFVWELFVQKVSKLKQAWMTLKGKVKKIRRCPVNQLKIFDEQ